MIIVGNFKDHITSFKDVVSLAAFVSRMKTKHTLVLAPSFAHLGSFLGKKGILLAAQDVSTFTAGAHTGEVSADTLSNAGVSYVILGHSERRINGETNSIVATKVCQALSANLKVILCVGEEVRDAHANYLGFITEEIVSSLRGIKDSDFKNVILAYDPIWAIGKSAEEAISPEQLEEMVLFLRKILQQEFGEKNMKAVKIIYGGSVSAENVKALSVPGIDGFLPGRASTTKESFKSLIDAIDA